MPPVLSSLKGIYILDEKGKVKKEVYEVLEVIKNAKAVGIGTIIDATPNDVGGRDPELYKELAKKTGFNIICN
jgi:predicted metal-dependent phosphotriesterase family hydrolase